MFDLTTIQLMNMEAASLCESGLQERTAVDVEAIRGMSESVIQISLAKGYDIIKAIDYFADKPKGPVIG